MADDDQAIPQAAPAAQAVAQKRKRRAKKKQARAVAAPTPAKRSNSGSGVVSVPKSVVYGLLIALAVVSTFVLGYYAGKADLFSGNGATGGDAKDAITIVEYSDFQCPFCSRALPALEQVKDTYGDSVTIVYKHFPLESIHPDALGAAIAAECVRELEGEEAFWTYHDTLFANQNALTTANLKSYASAQGLGSDFDTCLDTKATEDTVRKDIAEGMARGVRGTPSFWIEDELVVGALPFESFKAVIDRKLAGEAAPAPAAPTPTAPTPSAPTAPVDVATGKNVMGDADAPITIVEFSDFQCPFCQRFTQQTGSQIIDQYVATGKVRFAYRHFPLSFHQNAQKAAEASECAADQGKFWEFHDIMFERGSGDGTGLAVADLKAYAAELKLNTADFNTCLDSDAKAALVQADFAAGSAAGVSGTPAFFVNGKAIVGAQPFSAFQAMIDAELAAN